MLTHKEQRALIWFYTISCKFCTAPFTWKCGKMFVNLNQRFRFWNSFIWMMVLINLIFQFVQFGIVIKEKNINGSALHGTFLIAYFGHAVFKLNIEKYQSEMVHLLNQLFYMNSAWGNTKSHVTDKKDTQYTMQFQYFFVCLICVYVTHSI